MASYTVTTTAVQEAGIDFALVAENANRADQGQAALTKPQFLNAFVQGWLTTNVDRLRRSDADAVRVAFFAATAAQQAAVKTSLGLP